jgi:Fic family protein
MSALEKFLHEGDGMLPVIKAGLAHVQFETIHPFLDGNGRLGRLLIILLLHVDGVLQHPLLYLSLYFKTYRAEYYDALSRVRSNGDWEHWIAYYLRGVAAVAEDATERARMLRGIFSEDHDRIIARGTRSDVPVRIHETLKQRALLSVATASSITGLTAPPVRKALVLLQDLGIVDEVTGNKRDRVYRYTRYTDVLNEEARL